MEKMSVRKYLRIVWTIAAKDIVDAIKNKTTISIIIGVGLLMLSAQAMPLLLKLNSEPTTVLYHPGKSELVKELADSREFQLRRVPSQEELEKALSEAGEVQLGLVLPEDIETFVDAGKSLEIQGYFVYWAKSSEVDEIAVFFEEKFGEILGVPTRIDLDNPAVYPEPNADGQPFMISMSLIVAVITIGAFLVPYLILEEKEKHTLEALMVSPASYSQVVMGKAIAGLFYCFTAAAVVFIIYFSMISQWWLAIVGVIFGALFTVSIGLLVGSTFDNPGAMNLWLGLVIIVLLIPVLIGQTISSNFPAIISDLLPFIPSVAMSTVIRISFSNVMPADQLLKNLGIMIVSAAILLSVVVWKVRRLDRG
jgi:ABC-2 type transport system permease protein